MPLGLSLARAYAFCMDAISPRAVRMLANGSPEYVREHIARGSDPGYVGLCVAENKLMWDLLGPHLESAHPLDAGVAGYRDMAGSPAFRRQVAEVFEQRIFGRPVDPDSVVTMAGAGSILEALFTTLASPGEAVLVPTPSYAGFWPDLELRAGLRISPVHTGSETGFELTVESLEAAASAAETPVRALLLTNPDNPLGRVASPAQLERVMEWCEQRDIHLVVDEIYALSVFGDTPFTSVGALRSPLGEGVHVVWAFSKDFAMSGLRAGVLISEQPAVREAVAAQAVWGAVSSLTQEILGGMLTDAAFLDRYLTEMPRRLAASHRAVSDALGDAGIPHTASQAGFFLLVDLRAWLDEPSWPAEHRLWRRLLERAGVNLTPGAACHIAEPGFFRLCFASVPSEVAVEGVRRVAGVLA